MDREGVFPQLRCEGMVKVINLLQLRLARHDSNSTPHNWRKYILGIGGAYNQQRCVRRHRERNTGGTCDILTAAPTLTRVVLLIVISTFNVKATSVSGLLSL